MTTKRYKTIQINVSDAEMKDLRKRVIDCDTTIADFVAQLIRTALSENAQEAVRNAEQLFKPPLG